MSKLIPLGNSLPPLNSKVETLTKIANPKQATIEQPTIFSGTTTNTGISRVVPSESTAVFETHQGLVEDSGIEKKLLDSGFLPTEKILTKDDLGNVICHFIKVRDHVGRSSYVELDCDGDMGYIRVSSDDAVLTQSNEASIIPYSLKVGSYEASKGDIYGVGFECDNSICIMSRKDPSLEPVETVFHHTRESNDDMGIVASHPVPFPIVKMTEILANSDAVHKSIGTSHARMRNVAFNSCMKETEEMKKNVEHLEQEIDRFDRISREVSSVLSSSMEQLERWHSIYEQKGVTTPEEFEKVKSIRFNLTKRNDLTLDHISLCHSMKERSLKIAALVEELKAINDFSQTLFTGLSSIFTE